MHAEQRTGRSAIGKPKHRVRYPKRPVATEPPAPVFAAEPPRLDETIRLGSGNMLSPKAPRKPRNPASPIIRRAVHVPDRPDSREVVELADPPPRPTLPEETQPTPQALAGIKKKRSTIVEEMRTRSARRRQERKVRAWQSRAELAGW